MEEGESGDVIVEEKGEVGRINTGGKGRGEIVVEGKVRKENTDEIRERGNGYVKRDNDF